MVSKLEAFYRRSNAVTLTFLTAGIVEAITYSISAFLALEKAYDPCSADYDYLTTCHVDQLKFQSDFSTLLGYAVFYLCYPLLAMYTANPPKVLTVLITSLFTVAFAAYRAFDHTELVYAESYVLLGISISCTIVYAACTEYIVRRLPYGVSPTLPLKFKRYIYSQVLSCVCGFSGFFSLALFSTLICFMENNSWITLFAVLNFIVVPGYLLLAYLISRFHNSSLLPALSLCPTFANGFTTIYVLACTIGHKHDHKFLVDDYPFLATIIISGVSLATALLGCALAFIRLYLGSDEGHDYTPINADGEPQQTTDNSLMSDE